jgi:hypothetical protein
MNIPTWSQGIYQPGDFVLHNGKVYRKDNDTDQTAPDDVEGGWSEVPADQTNLAQYEVIAASFAGYEEKTRKHKEDVLAKLRAAELQPADVLAVLEAG